jgi:hypothetical protein
MTLPELESVLQKLYGSQEVPPPFHLLKALRTVRSGTTLAAAAAEVRTSPAHLKKLVEAEDAALHLLGERPTDFDSKALRVRATIGQLIIGNLAERVFEQTYQDTVGTSELHLEDDRLTRGDTDYLVKNGQNRPVFRLNIKFHGSQFRNAQTLVNLAPEDCFALATYKIFGALQKQEREHLPYIFVIVGVPHLTGSVVGEIVPANLVEFATLTRHSTKKIPGKRNIEEAIVAAVADNPDAFGVSQQLRSFDERLRGASWRVLSARKADSLLRTKLFERAYALRVRAFARNYPGAELDMHFSISEDLVPLEELLRVLRDGGVQALSVYLERGTF